jgi:biopolymer transport protein ExbB
MWLLLLLSIVSIALMVERVLYFMRNRIDVEALSAQLYELLRVRNLQGAWDLVQGSDAIECNVVAAGLSSLRGGTDACAEAMQSAKARLRPQLDANLSILATVLGIIKAAHELTAAGVGNNPSAVMSGVFEALVATAVGLFVAIPAVVAFNLFQRRVRKTMAQVDSLAHLVLASVRVEARPATAPGPASPTRVA